MMNAVMTTSFRLLPDRKWIINQERAFIFICWGCVHASQYRTVVISSYLNSCYKSCFCYGFPTVSPNLSLPPDRARYVVRGFTRHRVHPTQKPEDGLNSAMYFSFYPAAYRPVAVLHQSTTRSTSLAVIFWCHFSSSWSLPANTTTEENNTLSWFRSVGGWLGVGRRRWRKESTIRSIMGRYEGGL